VDATRWITVCALTLFLAEGFALSVFPRQSQQLFTEADPRMLQVAGLVETLLAAGLMAGILAG
jgi:hypothetical protein